VLKREVVLLKLRKHFEKKLPYFYAKNLNIKWSQKMWHLYTMEFYLVAKKNEILSFAGKWMEVENIILSKVSAAQKSKNHMFSLICGL
jgi:hypothetical protein